MNYYGYMRISTKEERSKQKFTRQEAALNKYAEKNDIDYVLIFKDDASGKSFSGRKEWEKLKRIVQPNDVIVFKSLDRFTRDADAGLVMYMELMNKGVNLVFLDNPTLSTDYMKNLLNIAEDQKDRIAKESMSFIARILLIAELDRAEKERISIVQRVKQGLAASPNKSGRKPGQLDKMTDELKADLKEYMTDRSIKGIDIMNKHNISRNTLKKYIARLKEEQEVKA